MSDLVLVDTSAWIEFFRSGGGEVALVVDRLLDLDRVAVTGVVRAELQQGTRSRREFDKLKSLLGALESLDLDGEPLWTAVGETGYALRRRGINGVGIPDLIIAAVAIDHGAPVLTFDEHFAKIAEVAPLTLFPKG